MHKPFEEYGRWWSPNHEVLGKQPFYGKLSWDPIKGAVIEAAGLSEEITNSLSANLGSLLHIQGQLDTIPCVTIDDAMVVSVTPAIFGPGRVKIASNTIAKGTDVLANIDQTMLLSLSCEITGLDIWAGGKTIRIDHPEDSRTVVECLPYQTEMFAEVGEIEIKIAQWNRTSNGVRHFSAEGVCTFELQSSETFTYETGRQILDELKAFLTLALDRPIVFEAIRGRLSDSEHTMPDGRPVSRHMEFLQTTDDHALASCKKKRDERRIPFFLHPTERSAKAFLAFREIYRTNRMALDFFFSHTYGTKSFINQQFADMVHGLEGLHRGLRGGRFIDQSAYDTAVLPALVAAIPADMDATLRVALKKRLEYGNEYSLRRRLKDLARFHKDYASAVIGKHGEFSDAVADLRNSLAHASGDEPPNRDTVNRYFVMLHRVRLLFQLELFHHLGFDAEFLKSCISRLSSVEFARRSL